MTQLSFPSFTEEFHFLLSHFHHPGNAETCRIVAQQLRIQLTPSPQWTWNYVMQVWHGRLPASEKFQRAVHLLYTSLSASQTSEKYEGVVVLAPIGQLPREVIVSGKPRKCVVCSKDFLPNSPRQRKCSLCGNRHSRSDYQ